MAAVLNFVGGMIKTTIITAGFVVAAGGGFLFYTKPTDKSLEDRIRKDLTSDSPNNPLMSGVAKGVTFFSDKKINDWMICKTAEVTLPDGKRAKYFGIANGWY